MKGNENGIKNSLIKASKCTYSFISRGQIFHFIKNFLGNIETENFRLSKLITKFPVYKTSLAVLSIKKITNSDFLGIITSDNQTWNFYFDLETVFKK